VDVRLIPFAANVDPRGTLTAIDDATHVPFPIHRVFLVHDVDPTTPRGGHAHRDTDQVILAAHGALNVRVTDGAEVQTYLLDSPTFGLFVPHMLWVDLLDFDSDTVCLVLASTLYDQRRSIRSWDEYADVVGAGPEQT
jgi:hypothetical protein